MNPEFDQPLVPADYPELKLLAWNRDPARPIAAEDAFALYERNWRFVDRERMSDREKALLDGLVQRFGKGKLLAG